MASNYAFHFHLALNFRLCTLKMFQLLGDSIRPQAPCRGFAPGALFTKGRKRWSVIRRSYVQCATVRPTVAIHERNRSYDRRKFVRKFTTYLQLSYSES